MTTRARRPIERGVCRYCGCTDERACEGGCHWVDDEHTECSRCYAQSIALKLDVPAVRGGLGVCIVDDVDAIGCVEMPARRVFALMTADQARKIAAHLQSLALELDIRRSASDGEG